MKILFLLSDSFEREQDAKPYHENIVDVVTELGHLGDSIQNTDYENSQSDSLTPLLM